MRRIAPRLLTPLLLCALPALASAQTCPGEDILGDIGQCTTAFEPAGAFGRLDDLAVFGGNSYDYFRFSLDANETLRTSVFFDDALGDIDLVLRQYDAGCGQNLAFSTTPTDDEEIVYVNNSGAPLDVLLQVDLVDGAFCADYDLEWERSFCPGDDAFEPNDSCGAALPLDAMTSPMGTLTVRLDDEDHYSITVAPGERLEASIAFSHGSADLDLQLFERVGGSCGSSLTSSQSTSNEETVAWTNVTGTPATIVINPYVYAFSSGSCAGYTLAWTKSSSPCFPDDPVMGSTFGGGPLYSGTDTAFVDGLRAVTGADDHFRVSTTVPEEVRTVRIDFSHAEGDIDIEAYEVDVTMGNQIVGSAIRSTSVGDFELIELQRALTGDFVVRVYRLGAAGECNGYDLTVAYRRFSDPGLGLTICEGTPAGGNFFGASCNVGGSLAVADNDVTLTSAGLPVNTFGIFVNSRGPGFVTPPASQGPLCINDGAVGRFSRPGEIVSSGPNGVAVLPIDLNDIPRPSTVSQVQVGERWAFQFWFRVGQSSSNFSDATMVWFE